MSHLFNLTYVFNVKSILADLQVVLSEHYEVQWYAKLTQVEARNGQGKNKLRTYRLFKNDFLTEPYFKCIMNFKHRSAIAKFRCGVAPIRLEIGRYEHLNVDERVCPVCNTEVESDEHVLTRCHAYIDIRNELYNYANDINADFSKINDFFFFFFF